ncbi:MAG: EAL domain-containing protein [Methylophaga sp.]|nr:EAL domain-containing protein [Methylophaga sp.]
MYLVAILIFISLAALVFYLFHLRQKISSLTVSQDKALESDERFRLLLQSIPNVSVQGYDKHRRVNFWNKASEKLYGYSHSEAIGQLLEDLIIPDEMRETVIELTDNWLAGGQEIPADELILKNKFGQPVAVYSSHVMSHDQHGNPEMYCIDIDLTTHKQDQIAIQYGEDKFKNIIKSSPVPYLLHDSAKNIILINDVFTRQFGYTLEDLSNLLDWGLKVYPDQEYGLEIQSLWKKRFEQAERNSGIFEPLEIDIHCKNGELRTVIADASPVTGSFHDDVLISLYDITERKKTELALKHSEAKSRSIIEASPIPFALHNTQRDVVFINNAFTRQYGYTIEDIPTYLEWGEKVYPDEAYGHKIQKIWRQRFEEAIETGNPFKPLEIEIRCKNGEIRTAMASATPVMGSFSGEILVSLYDITERKKEEQQRMLAATVFQYSSEGMMATDADRKIVTVNPAFCRITGYSKDEVLGKPALLLISDKQHLTFSDNLMEELESKGEWQGEIWNKRKNGDDFIAWLTVNTIYNDDGSVHQRVALFSDITEKKEAEMLALRRANYDDLTGLPNRNMFNDRLAQEIKKSNRTEKPLAVFFLDLDKFKEVNDTFGHQVGDHLLIDAAKRITDCVREADTVSRLGGDEFTVILADLDDVHSIERIANNIIDSLSQPFQLDENIAYVSASIGITLYPNDAQNVSDLLKNADQAMYMAKDSGRGCFRYFTKKMQQSAWERFNLLNDLRVALSKQQFELYYQPIMDLKTGKTHKAEALIRWHHPERGMVNPADFIPLAEDSGLIIEIGNWVFQQAVQQIKLCQRFSSDFQISINKSPIQFREHSDWIAVMEQEGVSGSNLVIEITEGVLMESREQVEEQLLNFRDGGIQVAIDDFGTGYSSLSYLNKFDIDYLKIDQSFTRNLSPSSSEMALSEAIIVMAHKLGLKVIAEGVETEQQCDLLTEAGCDYIQGYVFSKPLPAEQFEAFLETTTDRKIR